MTRQDLLKLAKRYLIADSGASVPNLVRKIQIAEGHAGCFATGRTSCEEIGCKWRPECLADPIKAANDPMGIDTGSEGDEADCRKD